MTISGMSPVPVVRQFDTDVRSHGTATGTRDGHLRQHQMVQFLRKLPERPGVRKVGTLRYLTVLGRIATPSRDSEPLSPLGPNVRPAGERPRPVSGGGIALNSFNLSRKTQRARRPRQRALSTVSHVAVARRMEPGGIEPPCRDGWRGASTRLAGDLLSARWLPSAASAGPSLSVV
jgi:hypothetical protein